MAQHDMDSTELRDASELGTVAYWQTEQKQRADIPAAEIAEEIATYLPNPGQYQQLISGARAEGETVVLELVNGQEMLLRIVTEHNAGAPAQGLSMEDRNLIVTGLNQLLLSSTLRDLDLDAATVEAVRARVTAL